MSLFRQLNELLQAFVRAIDPFDRRDVFSLCRTPSSGDGRASSGRNYSIETFQLVPKSLQRLSLQYQERESILILPQIPLSFPKLTSLVLTPTPDATRPESIHLNPHCDTTGSSDTQVGRVHTPSLLTRRCHVGTRKPFPV